MNKKIEALIASSRQVIRDCTLDNGSIVAANSTKPYFPATAKNYFYVWPRDAAFTCTAADFLGINIHDNFFDWCLNKAEGFRTNGLFYEKYYPNGLKALPRFQPDQTGSVIYAVWHHLKYQHISKPTAQQQELVQIAANGISRAWNGTNFSFTTNDLWEERICFPDLLENFTYSLAACIRGLQCANDLQPNEQWIRVAAQMKNRLDKHYMGFFVRSFGKLPDKRIDASVLGLAYPFEQYAPDDSRMSDTVAQIEKLLVINGGVYRYQMDEYDGWMHEGEHRKKGAGAWPLMNFWLSIYFARNNQKDKALKYFNWVLDSIGDDLLIPEQIFDNDIQVAVTPLMWSHVMFVLASKELGFL